MIKHYSKQAIPLPKMEIKKSNGAGAGEYNGSYRLELSAKIIALEHEEFIDDAICAAARDIAFKDGVTDVYILDKRQVKKALEEYMARCKPPEYPDTSGVDRGSANGG